MAGITRIVKDAPYGDTVRHHLIRDENPDQPLPGLGDACRQGQDSSLVSFIYWLYDKFQQGADAETVCRRLAG